MNKTKLLIIIAAVSGLYHPFSAFSQQAAVTEQELQRAEKMEDCPEKAAVFYEFGKFQLNHGSAAKAQEYLTKALRIFEKSDGRQSEAFSCLYMLSCIYLSRKAVVAKPAAKAPAK
jgi:flagellar basal body-associated protein FliL